MAWFRNRYLCARCQFEWENEWSCTCDDDCPKCGARHMSPYDDIELTRVIEKRAYGFVVLRSPESAEHTPNYEEVAEFPSLELAEAYLSDDDE